MACPMRIFVALFSVLLLAWVLASSLRGSDSPATTATKSAVFKPRGERSWWRFVVALFSGEIIYAYYHGTDRPPGDAGDGHDKTE